MSGGEVRRLSSQDLQMVQNLIENCIQLHMSKTDTVNVLLRDAKIQPGITELVWQRLEEENQEFFEVYYIRLALKDQIKLFNDLLKKQAALMQQIQSTGVVPMPVSNGCRMTQFKQNAGCYDMDQAGPSVSPGSLQPGVGPSLSFANGASSSLQAPTAFDLSTQSRRVDFLPNNTLNVDNSSSMRLMQGLNVNGGCVKTESGYPSNSQLIFDADSSIVGTHAPVEDASIVGLGHLDSNAQQLNDALLGLDTSFGQLGHIPKNFSFPDLSAYPNLLDNYPSLAFETTDSNNFVDSRSRGDLTEENMKLEAISESYSIEDYGASD